MGNTYNSRKKFKKGIAFYKKSDIINYVTRLKIKICTVYALVAQSTEQKYILVTNINL